LCGPAYSTKANNAEMDCGAARSSSGGRFDGRGCWVGRQDLRFGLPADREFPSNLPGDGGANQATGGGWAFWTTSIRVDFLLRKTRRPNQHRRGGDLFGQAIEWVRGVETSAGAVSGWTVQEKRRGRSSRLGHGPSSSPRLGNDFLEQDRARYGAFPARRE